MFSLSSFGLSNFSWYEKDFYVIFNDKEYKISKIQAIFISPLISKQIQIFKEINKFETRIDDKNSYFSIIIDLLEGKSVNIPNEAKDFVKEIGKIFQNKELQELNLNENKLPDKEEISLNPSNVVSILKKKFNNNENIEKEIEYIANHLFEMDENLIETLNVQHQKQIMFQMEQLNQKHKLYTISL